MLVANSFDLWQKDTFFSAAEEVQQSTDTMESAYRAWLRARKEGFMPQHLDKLNRELQMALGTAKWQLEEFERAVCLSYRNKGDDITITRHKEFVSAIEDQILRVETALKESLKVEGKKPFRWVNLDKEESDDLAHFLSGTPGTSRMIKDDRINEDYSFGSEEVSTGVKDISHSFIELQETKVPETVDEFSSRFDQISSNLRDRNALEIVVDTDNRESNELTEATLKEKGSKLFIWREKAKIYHRAKEVQSHTRKKLINWINNHLRGRQKTRGQHVSPILPIKSIRFVLALMLTVFLFVPFVLHST